MDALAMSDSARNALAIIRLGFVVDFLIDIRNVGW